MFEDMSNGLGWVDRGPRRTSSFDKSYQPGRVATNIRDEVRHENAWLNEPKVVGYNRPKADEPYLDGLRDFFKASIDRIEPKPRQDLSRVKQHLTDIMHDRRPVRDIGTERGVSGSSVVQGRKDAIVQLLEQFGGKEGLAKALQWYLATIGPDAVSRLPGWAHG